MLRTTRPVRILLTLGMSSAAILASGASPAWAAYPHSVVANETSDDPGPYHYGSATAGPSDDLAATSLRSSTTSITFTARTKALNASAAGSHTYSFQLLRSSGGGVFYSVRKAAGHNPGLYRVDDLHGGETKQACSSLKATFNYTAKTVQVSMKRSCLAVYKANAPLALETTVTRGTVGSQGTFDSIDHTPSGGRINVSLA